LLLQILAGLVLPMLVAGCQEPEVQVGPSVAPVANPYPASDPIEQQIAALKGARVGTWYAPADYFSSAGYFHAGMTDVLQAETRGSAVALLKPIIAQGTTALPHLFVHLQDSQKTYLYIEHRGDFGVMSWAGDYDVGPSGPREKLVDPEIDSPRRHVITIGDLCFFAIGQIVNREFDTVRWVPTACIDLSSPTTIPALAARVAKDWSGLTPEAHRESLLADFRNGRESQAILRLAFYYPQTAEPLALEGLKRPINSGNAREQAEFIQSLSPLRSNEVDAQVYRIFHNIGDDHLDELWKQNDLAVACMERLIGKGHDAEFAAYCAAYAPPDEAGDDLRDIRRRLRKR